MNNLAIELATWPNINQVILKDGSTALTGNLNLNNNNLINVKKGTGNKDAVNLKQLNEANSVIETNISKTYFKKEGTTLLTGNLNLNNHKITNLQQGTQETDYVNLKQLNESRITSHTNRECVFEYVVKLSSEFTADYGINSVNLINNFVDMPH